jgi:ribonuclease G
MGLIQMTRKRTRKPLTRLLCDPCPYCDGEGYIISIKTICYSIYREVLRYAADMTGPRLTLRVNPEVADFLHGEENHLIPGWKRTSESRSSYTRTSRYHMEAFEIIESAAELKKSAMPTGFSIGQK